MLKKKLFYILCLLIAIFITGCGTSNEVIDENVVEIMSIESALASSALQYPATNDLFYYNVYDDYIAITKYLGDETFIDNAGELATPTTVKIPDVIDGLPVYIIGDGTFSAASFETIEISKNVVSIGSSAFENCKNLKEVTFVDVIETCEGRESGNGVKTIGFAHLLRQLPCRTR